MRLRREAERVREPGSPQVRPVVGDGEAFLFANRVGDVEGRTAHSVFLQHGDDPIVWWDWDTLADEPDWLPGIDGSFPSRVLDYMYLGNLIEFGPTAELFMKPRKKDTEDYITGRFG